MKKTDYLVVGAGFSGAVTTRLIAESGKSVLVIDKRNHLGGNSYDYYNKSGVLVHKYGPHYFRTDDEKVWQFLSRFTKWHHIEYIVKTCVNGEIYDIPINLNTINKFFGKSFNKNQAKEYLEKIRIKIPQPKNAEEQVISKVGYEIYDNFFKNYTIKQWGIDPKKLDASVTARIPIRLNKDPRWVTAKYQAIPKDGYHALFKNMLDHKNIKVLLNTDYKDVIGKAKYKKLVYTGRIDEFFNFEYGKLPYRSQKFTFKTYNKTQYQPWVQINYPNDYKFNRIVEIKHVTGQKISKTTIMKDYPRDEGIPLYPVPSSSNNKLYLKYKNKADKLENVFFVGRLAQYQYINMDQAVASSIKTMNNDLKL